MRHSTTLHIRTTPGPPVACRPRGLDPDRLAVAKAEFNAILQDGTARRAESTWSSALHLVPKKDSGWRPCGDYRALNARTIHERYPVPHIQDYSHRLSGCNTFVKSTSSGLTTKSLSTLTTSKRQQSLHTLAFSNSLLCPSAYETPPKPSNVSWMRSLNFCFA